MLKETPANGILKTPPASRSQLLLALSAPCRVTHVLCESMCRTQSIAKWKCLRQQAVVGYSWQKYTNIWTKALLSAAVQPPCSEERRCSKAQVHHWLSCQAEHAAGERALVLYQSKQTPTRLKEREQGSHCSSYLLDQKRKGEFLAPDPQDHRTQDITGCLWEGF